MKGSRLFILALLIIIIPLLTSSSMAYGPPPTPTPAPGPPFPPGLEGWGEFFLKLWHRYGWWSLGILILALLASLAFTIYKKGTEEVAGAAVSWLKDRWFSWRLQRDTDATTRSYLDNIIKNFEWLDLASIARQQVITVDLESVYVPLFTPREPEVMGLVRRGITARADMLFARGAEDNLTPLTELLPRYDRLVIVGEAGSGKTTFLRFVALTLARSLRERKPGLARKKLGWLPEPFLVPLFIPLGAFGYYLQGLPPEEKAAANPELLFNYLLHHYRDLNLPRDFFLKRLEKGRFLVLLDGLDEVSRFPDRTFVSEVIAQFARRYHQNRYIVTCRPEGYVGAAQLSGFHRADLEPLRWEEVVEFIRRWNVVVERQKHGGKLPGSALRRAEDNAADLIHRIEATPAVREMAHNPLLLTVIAVIHYTVGTIPERRAELYERCVEVLLGWDIARIKFGTRVTEYPGIEELSLKTRGLLLEEVAFWMQEREQREVRRRELERLLLPRFRTGPGRDREAEEKAGTFLDWVVQRSYLMRETGEMMAFTHRAFQEYLAARRISRRDDLLEYVGKVLPSDWWEETLLLTAGHLSGCDPERARQLLEYVLRAEDPPGSPHHNLILAARALADAEQKLLGWELKDEVVRRLVEAIEKGGVEFKPCARFLAGDALGALGDIRPLDELVKIPAGPFLMGSTPEEVARWKEFVRQKVEEEVCKVEGRSKEELLEFLYAWLEAEKGVFEVHVAEFAIGKYPVTNAQFACFIEAGGYGERRYWTEAGWAWKEENEVTRPRFWDDVRFNGPNRPVVGVSWYEAVAYCNWLTERWREEGVIGPDEVVRLPTEAEWEKAARGTDGRIWPWGNEWDTGKCNSGENEIDTTTPVGVYPAGASPYGVLDMVGNVWEWCSTLWGEDWRKPDYGYPYRPDDGREDLEAEGARILRGGSWLDFRELARCASRLRDLPDLRLDVVGFRVVVSPGPR